MKIAAVLVTYNRLDMLRECISSLREQSQKIDEIIVVNNSSTDGTLGWLQNQNDITTITQENSGSAGGQFTGIKYAYEKGYDWIWCLEDEIIAEKNCLNQLINFTRTIDYNISAVSPIRVNNVDEISLGEIFKFYPKKLRHSKRYLRIKAKQFQNSSSFRIYSGTFEGLLINSNIIAKVGLPNKDMFLWFDDVEYCVRLNKFAPIYILGEAIVRKQAELSLHNANNLTSILIKELYGLRNLTFLEMNRNSDRIGDYIYKHLSIIFYLMRILKFYLGNIKLFPYAGSQLIKIIYYPLLSLINGYRGKLGKLDIKL